MAHWWAPAVLMEGLPLRLPRSVANSTSNVMRSGNQARFGGLCGDVVECGTYG